MTITVAVILRCDGRGQGCQGDYPFGPDPEPAAVTALWRHARDLGWSKYPQPDGRRISAHEAGAGTACGGAHTVPPQAVPGAGGRGVPEPRRGEGVVYAG